jgi:O-antigen/teichoic acid export membrane protein
LISSFLRELETPASASQSRPLTVGAIIAATSQVAVSALGIATTVALARLLGPSDWGSYSIAVSLLAILVTVGTLGVDHGITYYVSAGAWQPRDAFRSALGIAVVVGLIGVAVALGVRVAVPKAFAGLSVTLTIVAAAALPFSLTWLYTSSIALALDKYEASMLTPVARALLLLVFGVIGAVAFGLRGAVAAITLAATAVAAASVIWALARLPHTGPRHRFANLRRGLSFGLKGYAANVLQVFNYRVDLFILAAVASAASVGQYSLAVAATSLLWILPGALSSVLFPRVARLSQDGESATREMVERKSVRHASLAVFAGGVAVAAGLELFVVPLFGAEYKETTKLGLILLPGAAAVGLGSVLTSTIVGRGKPIYSLYGVLISTPLTIGIYLALIPELKATGAALGSSLSYLIGLIIAGYFYRRTTGRGVLPLLLPTRSEFDDFRHLPRAGIKWAERLSWRRRR